MRPDAQALFCKSLNHSRGSEAVTAWDFTRHRMFAEGGFAGGLIGLYRPLSSSWMVAALRPIDRNYVISID